MNPTVDKQRMRAVDIFRGLGLCCEFSFSALTALSVKKTENWGAGIVICVGQAGPDGATATQYVFL